MTRCRRGNWLSSYPTVMNGVILVFAGFVATGWWLTATGDEAFAQSLSTGIAAVVLFSAGLVLTTKAARRRGGLLRRRSSRAEAQTYRERHRR